MKKIYVQIAAFRDPELINTIDSILENASEPSRITICVAWQRFTEDDFEQIFKEKYLNHPQLRIIEIPAQDSKGACWARNLTQQHMTDEDYVLQIDSHHRFIKDWDTEIINRLESLRELGHPKPLITAYLPSYNPLSYPRERTPHPWKLTWERFTPEGMTFFRPAAFNKYGPDAIQSKELKGHTRTQWYSAHFMFADASWNKEIPYDPDLYFHGEEISLAVRSYTHGYDMFCPNYLIAWHEYTRAHRPKHWSVTTKYNHQILDCISQQRVKCVLNIDGHRDISPEEFKKDVDQYGLGNKRTLEEYETFSGITFKDRKISLDTIHHIPPPVSTITQRSNQFMYCLDIHESAAQLEDLTKFDRIAIIFEDKNGKSIYRRDLKPNEMLRLKKQLSELEGHVGGTKRDNIQVWETMWENPIVPDIAIYWPYSTKTGEWGNAVKITMRKIEPITSIDYRKLNDDDDDTPTPEPEKVEEQESKSILQLSC